MPTKTWKYHLCFTPHLLISLEFHIIPLLLGFLDECLIGLPNCLYYWYMLFQVLQGYTEYVCLEVLHWLHRNFPFIVIIILLYIFINLLLFGASQLCQVPIHPITPTSLLDSIRWSISEPTTSACTYTDSSWSEEASEQQTPTHDTNGEPNETEFLADILYRPLKERFDMYNALDQLNTYKNNNFKLYSNIACFFSLLSQWEKRGGIQKPFNYYTFSNWSLRGAGAHIKNILQQWWIHMYTVIGLYLQLLSGTQYYSVHIWFSEEL